MIPIFGLYVFRVRFHACAGSIINIKQYFIYHIWKKLNFILVLRVKHGRITLKSHLPSPEISNTVPCIENINNHNFMLIFIVPSMNILSLFL